MKTQQCLDCASDNPCVNCVAYRSLIDRRDVWWFEGILRERVRARWHYVSQKLFKLLYKLFNEYMWIVQDYNYFTRTGQSQTVPLHVLSILSSWSHQLKISLFRDRRSNIPTWLSADCDRTPSIGAPLEYINVYSLIYSFFYSQKPVATDLHFINHQEPRFQLKIIFTVLLKKKSPSSWMAWCEQINTRFSFSGRTIHLFILEYVKAHFSNIQELLIIWMSVLTSCIITWEKRTILTPPSPPAWSLVWRIRPPLLLLKK